MSPPSCFTPSPPFGASERREDLLSPRAMGGFLARLIAEADLGTPHIVAPDVGTSAALFAAAATRSGIASVIVGTGGAAVPLQLGEPLTRGCSTPTSRSTAGWTRARSSRGGGHDRGRGTRRHPRGLSRLLRRRPLRRVDALRPPVSRGAARACRAAAADHDAGDDHQRPPRPRCPARERRVPRPATCRTAGSPSSTPGTSSGRRRRRSTPRSSSRRSPPISRREVWQRPPLMHRHWRDGVEPGPRPGHPAGSIARPHLKINASPGQTSTCQEQ